jgi:hypothetical protein
MWQEEYDMEYVQMWYRTCVVYSDRDSCERIEVNTNEPPSRRSGVGHCTVCYLRINAGAAIEASLSDSRSTNFARSFIFVSGK